MFTVIVLLSICVLIYSVYWFFQGYLYPKALKKIEEAVEAENYGDVKMRIAKLSKARKEDAIVKWYEAQANMGQGQYILAIVALQDIIKQRQYTHGLKEYKVHEALAKAYEKTGRLKEAMVEMQYVLHFQPDNFDSNYSLGTIYYQQNKYDLALQYLTRAKHLKDTVADIHYMIGDITYARKDPKVAIDHFQRCVSLSPKTYKAFFKMGKIYYEQRNYVHAAENFEVGQRDKVHGKEASAYLGLSFYYMKNYDEAIAKLELAEQRLDSKNPLYMHVAETLGEAYLENRQLDEANDMWKKIITKDPHNGKARIRLNLFHRVLPDDKLKEFFCLSKEAMQERLTTLLSKMGFFIDSLEAKDDNIINIIANRTIMVKAKHTFVLVVNRTPNHLKVDDLREAFALIKANHANQAYVMTPFNFQEECEQFIVSRPIELINGEQFSKVLHGEDIF